MSTANTILTQAKKWVGLKETDRSHMTVIDVYNSHKPLARGYKLKSTDSWCAAFISALFIECKATDIFVSECSCQKMIDLCKSKGIWTENENMTPKPGDILFYDWQDTGTPADNKGWSDHVGIVESVTGKTITVIEGNKDNCVGRRKITVNAKGLRGYARPKYTPEKPTVTYYKKCDYKGNSLVDALKSIGEKSDFNTRTKIAHKNGITNYRGSAKSNTTLLNLLKKGKLIK